MGKEFPQVLDAECPVTREGFLVVDGGIDGVQKAVELKIKGWRTTRSMPSGVLHEVRRGHHE